MEKSILAILISGSIPTLVWFFCGVNYYWDYVMTFWNEDVTTQLYDFIVVGAGSSGCVVAYRLAAQNYKVLLLEAGGDPIPLNAIPGMALDLIGYKEQDFWYKSIEQKNVGLSHYDQKIYHNRGKVLGGSSSLNYMFYLRGHPKDYDLWANVTQDEGWSYENVLPFFKKSIYQYRGEFQQNKKHYEGSPYGFLTISQLYFGKLFETLNNAGIELGYTGNLDVNGPQSHGVGKIEVTQRNGERASAYNAILMHKKALSSLTIAKYSQATKVLFDGKKATGIEFYKYGKKLKAKATKEIILSAGAFDSPKLLLLSGIGPMKSLESIGIKVKQDLPVGKNLQDHFSVLLYPFTTMPGTSFIFERDLGFRNILEYLWKGTGAMTAATGFIAQFFYTSPGHSWANIQSAFAPIGVSKLVHESFARALSIESEVISEFITPAHGKDGFLFLPTLVQPKSRGEMRLADKNPWSDPLIDPNPFSHPDDIKAMIAGINESLKFTETKSFQSVGAKFESPYFSRCNTHPFKSNAYWECYIRHTTMSIWHPVGTCRMGRENEPTTVVDSKLRVVGIDALRVIDASIMPYIVNANTNAPSIMIGEKGADLILEHWAQQFEVCHKIQLLIPSYQRKCFYSTKY